MNQQQEFGFARGVVEYWSPYLEAVGINTSDWQPYEIFELAQIVRRDKDVEKAGRTLHLAWAANRAATARNEPETTPENITYEEARTWIPPDMTLQAVQVLPMVKKAVLKSRVLNARSRNTRR